MMRKQTQDRIAEIATIDNCTFMEAEQLLKLSEPILFEVDD